MQCIIESYAIEGFNTSWCKAFRYLDGDAIHVRRRCGHLRVIIDDSEEKRSCGKKASPKTIKDWGNVISPRNGPPYNR